MIRLIKALDLGLQGQRSYRIRLSLTTLSIPCRAHHGSNQPSPWAGSGSLSPDRIRPLLFSDNWPPGWAIGLTTICGPSGLAGIENLLWYTQLAYLQHPHYVQGNFVGYYAHGRGGFENIGTRSSSTTRLLTRVSPRHDSILGCHRRDWLKCLDPAVAQIQWVELYGAVLARPEVVNM